MLLLTDYRAPQRAPDCGQPWNYSLWHTYTPNKMIIILDILVIQVISTVWFAPTQGLLLCNHHSRLTEGVPPPLVHRRALAGVSVTEAAASDHHVVKGVVIFVLGVSAFP